MRNPMYRVNLLEPSIEKLEVKARTPKYVAYVRDDDPIVRRDRTDSQTLIWCETLDEARTALIEGLERKIAAWEMLIRRALGTRDLLLNYEANPLTTILKTDEAHADEESRQADEVKAQSNSVSEEDGRSNVL